MAESDVLSEIEVLQSIYVDELLVNRRQDGDWEVSLVLYPSTAEDSVSQFVRLTLTLTLDQQYPSSSPAISIHKPRGLSDDKISSVQKCLQLEAQSCLGSPVLYQLIEKAKEILTESNIPHGNCVICLYGFKEGETFYKTSCYHYFHSHCLGRYASHSERELRLREKELEEDKTRDRADRQELTVVCPVCREPLTYDVDQLLCSPAPQLPELDEAAIGSKFQQKWRELQKLLERQKSKGGIIDLEVESNRFLIHTNETPPAAGNENLDADASPGTREPSACHVPSCEAGVRADQSGSGLSHCRGGPGQRRQNQARGPRRGGRSRPQHRRAAPPITEHLDKLSLSSGCTEGPIRAKAQGNQMQQVNAELCQPKTGRTVSAEQQETPVSPDGQTECPKDAAGGRGHSGRRRGPHRADSDTAARGRYHWDGRASKSRGGGPSNQYSREGGPGNQYSRGGGPGNQYSREGGPGNPYSREGGPGNQYSRGGGPGNPYSRGGGPGNPYSRGGGPGNPYSREGGPGNPYSRGGGPGNQYSRGGGPGNQYSGGGGPGNPYSRGGGGPHWSHDRGFQNKVVERERRGEEVL